MNRTGQGLVSALELERLDFYRVSELHGGLMLGQLVRRVRDAELILELTRHSAEEIVHARLWAETMIAVGGAPRPGRATYQSYYARAIGTPTSVLQVLALTQVFERRVYRHFLHHARLPGTHPVVRATLERMCEEEKHHLSWVKRWLDREEARRPGRVGALMDRYAAIDEAIYTRLLVDFGFEQAA